MAEKRSGAVSSLEATTSSGVEGRRSAALTVAVVVLVALLAALAGCAPRCNTVYGDIQFNRPDGWKVKTMQEDVMSIRSDAASARGTYVFVYKTPVDFDEASMDDSRLETALTVNARRWLADKMHRDGSQATFGDLSDRNGLRRINGVSSTSVFVVTSYKGNMYVFWWQSDPDEYGVSVTDMLDMTHSMRKA